jgi:hypothetical protein
MLSVVKRVKDRDIENSANALIANRIYGNGAETRLGLSLLFQQLIDKRAKHHQILSVGS